MFPKRVVGCKGGSRYVEGCWGLLYLKMEKCFGFLVLGFLVSCFLVYWFIGFKVSKIYQISISCFLIDIDHISKLFKILLNGSAGFFGATFSKIVNKWIYDFFTFVKIYIFLQYDPGFFLDFF